MKLFIKNMVCYRCVVLVERLLDELDIKAKKILLGEVILDDTIPESTLNLLSTSLQSYGLELLQNPHKQLVNTVKVLIISKVQTTNIERHFKLSSFLTKSTLKDYSFLTKLFTQEEGMTIERFYMLQKIEKAKELLLYDISHISEIATMLGFSSPQHFATQFKKRTGINPSSFKSLGYEHRMPIDNLTNRLV